MSLDNKPSNTNKPAKVGGVSSKSGTHPAASLSNMTVRRTGGPGQTWMNLTKGEVEEYKHTQSKPQSKPEQAQPSLFKRLAGMFKGRGNTGS